MEEIKILFYVLTSFLGIQNGHIAAEKTTVTLSPDKHTITIVQEDLFSVLQSEEDSIAIVANWEQLQKRPMWISELNTLTEKNVATSIDNNKYMATITFNYQKEEDIRALGMWFKKETNQFFINNLPLDNLSTSDGKREDLYWVFDGTKDFSFTFEPYGTKMPEKYHKLKRSLASILGN